jgi:hypothetical protein
VVLYTFTRNIFPLPSILSKLSWRSKSKFRRLSHGTGSPTLPIFMQGSNTLEKAPSRESEATTNTRPSPTNSRPGSAQGDRPVANANPFADTNVIIITSPVPSHQRQNDGQLKTPTLVKSNSISSVTSSIRKGSVGLAKDGRTVIKKPQPTAWSSEHRLYESRSGQGQVRRTKSLEV